jgi:Domain of unknown function (DUF4262)
MDNDTKIVENVKEYGWHIINVFGDESHKQFSYTIGLFKSFNAPELFISGLDGNVASAVINNIGDEIAKGFKIIPKVENNDFFTGYSCYFDFVDRSKYDTYFSKAVWFYQGNDFPVLQCVWPNKIHLYPWQTEMPFNQDVLISPFK